MTDRLEWFERSLATLENRHNQLVQDFHSHAEQPVHAGFVDILREIRVDLQMLQARWIQVGGAVIFLLITILLSLLGVLWTLTRAAVLPPATAVTQRPTCALFATQAAAQAFYRDNPMTGAVLDSNRDGVACQSNVAPYDTVPVTR